MARVIVTLKIMPDSPSINLEDIVPKVQQRITSFAGKTEFKVEIEPIAFGLKALKILFVLDEEKGSTEKLEQEISTLPHVQSVEVVDVRRSIG